MEEFSKTGRKLRPRRNAGTAQRAERVEIGEHRTFGEHKTFGEHRTFGEHKSYGDHKPGFGGRKPGFGGRKPGFGSRPESEGRKFGSEGRKPGFGGRKPGFGSRPESEGRKFGSEGRKPGFEGRKPGFGGRKPFIKDEARFNRNSDEGISRMINRRPQVDNRHVSDFDAAPSFIKDEMRLNKFIANSGVCSRREADTLIQAGVVTVNGEVVTELGTKVNIYNDDIRFNGERLKGEEKVYIVMNKPKGYVTTASDPHAEKTVMDLLTGCESRVFPVGRLDKNTTGVLMFTNDGEITERLTHPSYDKKKIYQVILNRPLKDEDKDAILAGVTLTDGVEQADELEFIDENDHRKLGIEIHSGKNRIVRRIFESLGYDVRALDRVYFAGLTKKGLKKGEWRFLSEGEINILKMGAYI